MNTKLAEETMLRMRTTKSENPIFNGDVLYRSHRITLDFLERLHADEREHTLLSIRNHIWYDLSEDLFPVLFGTGPHGIEVFMDSFVEPSDYFFPEVIFVMYAHLSKVQTVNMQVAVPPRFDLVNQAMLVKNKKVFFCSACGTPYFWGDRSCTQCGHPHDYTKFKEFLNDF